MLQLSPVNCFKVIDRTFDLMLMNLTLTYFNIGTCTGFWIHCVLHLVVLPHVVPKFRSHHWGRYAWSILLALCFMSRLQWEFNQCYMWQKTHSGDNYWSIRHTIVMWRSVSVELLCRSQWTLFKIFGQYIFLNYFRKPILFILLWFFEYVTSYYCHDVKWLTKTKPLR